MSLTYYAGPGKIFMQAPGVTPATVVGFQPEGVNGAITCGVKETATQRGAAQFGNLLRTLDSQMAELTCTPFDNWGLLPVLFPAYLGVDTSAITTGNGGVVAGAAAALKVGTMPHDPSGTGAMSPGGAFGSDGRSYNFVRCALTKPPSMKLGAGEKLYGQITITALGDLQKKPGDSAWLMSATPVVEPGANADPDTAGFNSSSFAQSHWTGVWSPFSGVTLEAEDGWDLETECTFNTITVQKVARIIKLASCQFSIKARLVGMTHSQLSAKVLAHTGGSIIVETTPQDLVLTSSSGKTITLKNCTVQDGSFELGGTKLGTGTVQFIQTINISGNAPTGPSLVFSA